MSIDGVVPFAVPVVRFEGDVGEFGVGDLDAGRIPVWVVGGLDSESGCGRGGGDEFDDRAKARGGAVPASSW